MTGAGDATAVPWWWSAAVVTLLGALALFKLSHTEADADLWGHLRFGLDWLASRQVDRPDTYSYLTDGVRWINHEWLAEVALALAWRAAGPLGIALEKTALGLLLAWLVFAHLRRQGVGLLGSGLQTTLLIVAVSPGLGSLRPQAFTYVAFFLTLQTLVRADAGDRRALWRLPPLFALWPNLHGGFAAGAAAMTLWWTARMTTDLARSRMRRGRDVGGGSGADHTPRAAVISGIPVLAALLATLLNPYGVDLWRFLGENLGPRPDITEWQPILLFRSDGMLYALLLALASVGLARTRRPRSPALMVLFLALACAPHTAIRHLPLFALAVIALAGSHLADACSQWTPRLDRARWPSFLRRTDADAGRAGSTRHLRPFAALMLVEAMVLVAIAVARLPEVTYHAEKYPVRAVAWLKASGVEGNLLTFFDWGEYALWHLSPRLRVSNDGRRETVYLKSLRDEQHAWLFAAEGWDAILGRGAPPLALISTRFPAYQLLRGRPEWVLLLKEGDSALFGRKDHAVTARLQRTPLPAPVSPGARLAFP